MSFLIYLIGFAILIGGVVWVLVTAAVSSLNVVVASVILLGYRHHDGRIAYTRQGSGLTILD